MKAPNLRTFMRSRALKAGVLLVAPVALLLLLLLFLLALEGVSFAVALILYAVIVIEGIGIAVWALSGTSRNNALAELEEYEHRSERAMTQQYFYERNRVQALASYIRWAAKSNIKKVIGGSDTTYPRREIARIIRGILLERPVSQQILDSRLSADLEFVLNPEDDDAEEKEAPKNNSNKLARRQGSAGKKLLGSWAITKKNKKRGSYISSLERVVSFLESQPSSSPSH